MELVLTFLIIFSIIGSAGNLVSLSIFSRRSFKSFPSRNFYQGLLLVDTLYLLYATVTEYLDQFSNIYLWSMFSCKLSRYFDLVISSVATWILTYISIERYILIRYPNIKIINRAYYKCLIIIAIILFNMGCFSPIVLIGTVLNNTNHSKSRASSCGYSDHSYNNIIYYSDLFIATLLPFVLMTIFSFLLIYSIFKSRIRVLRLKTSVLDRKRIRKDVKVALGLIILNICFVALNLPICVEEILQGNVIDQTSFNFI